MPTHPAILQPLRQVDPGAPTNRVLCGDNASALDQSCQRTPSPNPGGVVRQPGDVALDRKIGSNGAERHLEQLRMTVVWCDRHKEAVIPLRLQH